MTKDPSRSVPISQDSFCWTLPSRLVALILGFLLMSAVWSPLARAEALGTIAGRVSNDATKEFLVSAVVRIDQTNLSTTTDTSGYYNLQVPAGTHVLVVTYTGLDTERQTIVVEAGRLQNKDIAMNSGVYQLETFVVKSIREGSAAAIQNQRQAMNVRTVAAVDAFGNPGAGVGELLQRLPGVAADVGAGGQAGGIYIRGMTQDFSSLLVDGNQIATSGGTTLSNLNVYFGQVSTGNVASLEIIKAPTPDMDGNAVAGYINLRTKRAFDQTPGRRVTLAAGTSWTALHEDRSVPGKDLAKLDLLSIHYSDVLSVRGGKNNLGLSISITANAGSGRLSELGPRLGTGNAAQVAYTVAAPANPGAPLEPLVRGYSAGHLGADSVATRAFTYGFNTDYKINENTVVYFKSTYALGRNPSGAAPSYFRWRVATGSNTSRPLTMFAPGSTFDVTTIPSAVVTNESLLYIRESESFTLGSGLERKLFSGTGKLNFDMNYSSTRTGYPAINTGSITLSGVGLQIDRRGRDPWFPQVTQISGPSWSDPANYSLVAGSTRLTYRAPSERWGFGSDFRKDLATSVPAYIKMGVKFSRLHGSTSRNFGYYTYSGPSTTAANGGITPYLGYTMKMSGGNYGPFPFVQLYTTGRPGDPWKNPANFTQNASDIYNSIQQSGINNMEATEEVRAGYAMGQMQLGRLRVLGGVRVEQTVSSGAHNLVVYNANNTNLGAAADPAANAARARDTIRGWVKSPEKDYNNVFPSLHFVYEIGRGFQGRLSYNTSISRPSPTLLLPVASSPNVTAQTISAGNPALKPYTSDNFEAAVEKYFEPVGLISAGVFLKEIKNYTRSFPTVIGSGSDNGFGGEYAGWTLNQTRNVGSARIRGFEVNYSQQYTSLPGFLRGFGTNANFTYLDTYGDFGSANGFTNRLPNLTPRSWNAGISYRGYGLDVRLLANYRSTYYKSSTPGTHGSGAGILPVQANVPGSGIYDVYSDERLLLDFKGQYSFNRIYSMYFEVYNITNELVTTEFVYAFDRKIPSYANGSGVTFNIGLKARF
ncbi:MAG: TonB-dependent receptor [Opitutae bacterium]|nr:TonB-dependent receptor [Opitutae bacterium]